jgi:hypothetical protein
MNRGKSVDGSCPLHVWGTVLVFAWKNREKPTNTSKPQSLQDVSESIFEAGNLGMRSRNFEHLLAMFGAFSLMPILTSSSDEWLRLSRSLNYAFRQRLYMQFSPSPSHPAGNYH